jgi:nitrile hydratase accessory protein
VKNFAEPWEAQAFALAVALNERGLLDWTEWSQALAAELEGAESYYHAWLTALEKLVCERFSDPETLAHYRDAWADAAEHTPHGTPIVPHF